MVYSNAILVFHYLTFIEISSRQGGIVVKRMLRATYLFCIVFSTLIVGQQVHHAVISEIRYDERSGLNEEFVELYNPTLDTIWLTDWSLAYMSKSGTTWRKKVIFTSECRIRPYGFFLWGGDGVAPLPDVAESNQSSIRLSNSGGHIALFDSSGHIIDLVAWEGGESPEGETDGGITEDGGSLERKATAESTSESMAPAGQEAACGNGYDTDHNGEDFIVQPLEQVVPQNSKSKQEPDPLQVIGRGSATVLPKWIFCDSPSEVRLRVRSESGCVIRRLGVVIPWKTGDISLEGQSVAQAVTVFSEDTLLVSNIQLSDTMTIDIIISGLEIAEISEKICWTVLSETDLVSKLMPILKFPSTEVCKSPVQIAGLHQNDETGIPLMLNEKTAVTGIVTAGTGTFSSTTTEVYIQDATGGILLSDTRIPVQLTLGDSVAIQGVVGQSRGMTLLTPSWEYVSVYSHGHSPPDPVQLTCQEVNTLFQSDYSEPHEGRLIRLENVTVNSHDSTLTDDTGVCDLRLCTDEGLPVPECAVHITGILGQCKAGVSPDDPPFKSDYFILPRFETDVEPASIADLQQEETTPESWQLSQNYPNPFNGGTAISFSVPVKSEVCVRIFDVRGRIVRQFEEQEYRPGWYSLQWDGLNRDGIPVSSGVYLVRLQGRRFNDQVKALLLK